MLGRGSFPISLKFRLNFGRIVHIFGVFLRYFCASVLEITAPYSLTYFAVRSRIGTVRRATHYGTEFGVDLYGTADGFVWYGVWYGLYFAEFGEK